MRSRSILSAVMLGAVMASQNAAALSCAEPNLVKVLEEIKASPKVYYVLSGQFERPMQTVTTGHWKNPVYEGNKKVTVTKTFFRGDSLGVVRDADYPLDGFPVDIKTSCVGQWCSKAPSPMRSYIAFVEAQEGQTGLLNVGPCPKYIYEATSENVEAVRHCLHRTCAP